MTKEEYREYLKKPHWKEVKDRIFFKREKICYCCFKRKVKLDLHHKTYKRLGMEKDKDLVYVCQECHEIIHKQYQLNKDKRGVNIAQITEMLRSKNRTHFKKIKAATHHTIPGKPKYPHFKKHPNQKKWYSKVNVFSPKEIVEYKKKLAETT